jgi:hypothetical protein
MRGFSAQPGTDTAVDSCSRKSGRNCINGLEQEPNLFVYSRATSSGRVGFLSYGTANAKGLGVKQLRERGIYLAPNGDSFVASRERKTTSDGKRIFSRVGSRLSYFLFRRYEWAFHGTPDYEVATTGSLLPLKPGSDLRHEEWQPDQLFDTGATAGAH